VSSNNSGDAVHEIEEDLAGEASANSDPDSRSRMTGVEEQALAEASESFKILTAFFKLSVPAVGETVSFTPLEHLQPIHFQRWSPQIEAERAKMHESQRVALRHGSVTATAPPPPPPPPDAASPERAIVPSTVRLAHLEESSELERFCVVSLCRSLSLDNIMGLLTGALLEKQIVVLCPNVGHLSSIVLSLVPLLRPFVWESFFLPVLPEIMLNFLDAPVPFIVGMQHKTSEVKSASRSLMRVNVYKDKVSFPHSMPQLPRAKELLAALRPIHAKLRDATDGHRRPVHHVSVVEQQLARHFAGLVREHLQSLVENLRLYAFTDVNDPSEKHTVLHKDIFVESFPKPERPFMKLFVETQQFSVFQDERLQNE